MKKTLTALATIAILAAPHAMAEGKSYKVSAFDSIEVEGAMKVVYKTASETSVVVETPSGDYSDAKITSEGGTLTVSRESLNKKSGWFSWGGGSVSVSDDGKTVKVNGKKKPAYTVYVTGPDLKSAKASQSSRFESSTINAGDFEAAVSSSSDMVLAGKSGATELKASSSGDLKAKGLKADTVDISASSSGDVEATVTGKGENEISSSSSGDVTLNSLGAATFIVDASSGASVELSGACSSITVSASSGSDVEGEKLLCANAKANASSGASVELYATTTANGQASSGADISFAGRPKTQDISKSSGGSVSFSD